MNASRHCPYSLLTSLLLALGMANAVTADSPAVPDLAFLLIGQSNMAGRAPLQEEDRKPLAGTLLLDNRGKWIPATNPLNRFATNRKNLSMQRMGPGDGFARRLHKALPRKRVGLIVNARGGSSIDQWAKGESLYDNSLKRVLAIKGLKLAGVIWHQGESNRDDPRYGEKMSLLIKNLRKDLDSPRLPFIAGQVFGAGPVNQHIKNLPRLVPNTGFAETVGLSVFDKVHFDRSSQLLLGSRYAEAYLRLTGQLPR
ncbi:MAG: sialate O-acetylesterase [Pirellulaceae bacterium]